MPHDNLRVEFGGEEIDGFYKDLVSLDVELDEQLAGMFRMSLALKRPGGSWSHVDEEHFAVWRRVVVTAGLVNDTRQLIDGYITHVRPEFGAELDQCLLEVWGMDASVLMDRVERLKDWPNRTDSDIATEVFEEHGLTPEVTDTKIVHDAELSTIIQRETDIQFLNRLARRNGYECFVDGRVGHFRPPAVDDTPQPVLTVHFGDETNVNWFCLEIDALAQSSVAMFQVDHVNGEVLDTSADTGHQPLGASPATSYLGDNMKPGIVYIRRTVTTGVAEMADLCQGLFDQGEWFVTGEGEVAANKYGGILMPRGTVTVKGVGETHSGVYYVTHVTHTFGPDGYFQKFRVKRNALRPTGDEDFSTGGDGLLAELGGGSR